MLVSVVIYKETSLSGAFLSRANLSKANLYEADLGGATLCNTVTPWGIDNSGC